MKDRFLRILILLFLIATFNCSEDNPVGSEADKYYGVWTWMKTVGGIFPTVREPENGDVIKIYFDDNEIFKLVKNDSIKVFSKYIVEEKENEWDRITYSNIKTYNYYFNPSINYTQLKSDTLIIWDGYMDGYFSFYKRVY